jgi:hypothetical protein
VVGYVSDFACLDKTRLLYDGGVFSIYIIQFLLERIDGGGVWLWVVLVYTKIVHCM